MGGRERVGAYHKFSKSGRKQIFHRHLPKGEKNRKMLTKLGQSY